MVLSLRKAGDKALGLISRRSDDLHLSADEDLGI